MAIMSFITAHSAEIGLYAALLFISYKAATYIHNVYFHPLSKFPGPKICAATRLYEFYWDAVQHGRFWSRLPLLHDKYGPIVRIAPNELHIRDAEFFDHMFGFRPLDKEAMTAKQFGMKHALFGTEDYKLYTKRRAAFGDAFSRSKMLKLQPMISEHIDKACRWIDEQREGGKPVDLAYIYRAMPAEIITQYLFGQEHDFIHDTKTVKMLYDKSYDTVFGLFALGRFIPYQIPLFTSLARQLLKQALGFPEPGSAWMSLYMLARKLVNNVVEEHKNPSSSSKSTYEGVFAHFLDSNLPQADKQGAPLAEQAVAIWSGGFDTVGFSLTAGTYLLLRNPTALHKLQAELATAWPNPTTDPPSMAALEALPYLSAVLKEALRLAPGSPCRLGRINRTEAEHYGKWTIPPGTIINMSIPDVHHDPSIFGASPLSFRPERWLAPEATTTGKDLDRHMLAFSKGTRVCPGIELAWVEFRLIFATLFRRYDVELVPGGVGDDDVLMYREGFTPIAKNWTHRLPVRMEAVAA